MKQKQNLLRKYFQHVILLAMLFFISCQNKNKTGCEDFKTGTFRYGEKDWSAVKITRDQNMQIETMGDTLSAYFTIKWTSDCNYDLIVEKVIYKSETQKPDIKPLHITITEVENDSTYRYSSSGGAEGSHEGIMVKTSSSIK